MATVSNAFTTKIAKGNREQLEGVIYNIDPTETPLFSLAGKKNVKGVSFDWQIEKLPDPSNNAPQVEAYVNVNSAPTGTTRIQATTQLNKRDATVSGDQQAADAAGKPEGEMAHQMALASKALKLDIDRAYGSTQPRVDDNGTVGSQTEGFAHYLKTNVSRGAGGASAASSTATVTAGTARPLTEDLFDDVLQLAWTNGAKCDWALVGGFQKRVISKFTGRQNGRYETKVGELAIGGVNLLMSDFGDIKISLSRNIDQSSVLIIDPNYVKTAFFRGFDTYPVAKTGDADTKVIHARWGVQVSNEAAHAAIFDLTTSK
ncbi:hypothetical protein FF100_22085 [Methylobacterium terricola]|uniref:Phage major capsid protein, HK97 family n=1 Tax=Methylobacterium terricola TaxID=2583531 RepID=A0A5C4LC86_9HYPH|nr:DUF5309 family protein [Methylobacterium terricola]TNC10843.1 hypothetical protein FF100_22085 [Methylobacterium terricola]